MRNGLLHFALAALVALFATGCLSNEELSPAEVNAGLVKRDTEKQAFKAGQARWEKAKPPAYSFQLSRNCFCFPYGRMEVYVDGDRVVKVDTIAGVEGPYDLESFHNAPNMDEVFSQIRGFLDDPEYEVTASYNEKLGYPVSVKIHHLLQYNDADADFQIASFRPDH